MQTKNEYWWVKKRKTVVQKWKWITDSIDCKDDNSFSVEKIKLNWFDLKFISKKPVTPTIKSYQRLAVVNAKQSILQTLN